MVICVLYVNNISSKSISFLNNPSCFSELMKAPSTQMVHQWQPLVKKTFTWTVFIDIYVPELSWRDGGTGGCRFIQRFSLSFFFLILSSSPTIIQLIDIRWWRSLSLTSGGSVLKPLGTDRWTNRQKHTSGLRELIIVFLWIFQMVSFASTNTSINVHRI